MVVRAAYYGLEQSTTFLDHLHQVCRILNVHLHVLDTLFPVHDVNLLFWNYDQPYDAFLAEQLRTSYTFVVHLPYKPPREQIRYSSDASDFLLHNIRIFVLRIPWDYEADEWALAVILDSHRLKVPLTFALDPTWAAHYAKILKRSSSWTLRS